MKEHERNKRKATNPLTNSNLKDLLLSCFSREKEDFKIKDCNHHMVLFIEILRMARLQNGTLDHIPNFKYILEEREGWPFTKGKVSPYTEVLNF